jgi:pterin-4a-carbinolamine dehydratase
MQPSTQRLTRWALQDPAFKECSNGGLIFFDTRKDARMYRWIHHPEWRRTCKIVKVQLVVTQVE